MTLTRLSLILKNGVSGDDDVMQQSRNIWGDPIGSIGMSPEMRRWWSQWILVKDKYSGEYHIIRRPKDDTNHDNPDKNASLDGGREGE